MALSSPKHAQKPLASVVGGKGMIFYAFPAMAAAIPTIPAYILLPGFYADTLGVGLMVTGMVLFAVRLIDMVTDPLVGWLSDISQRRKIWVAIGAMIAGVGMWKLFSPPDHPDAVYLFVWATILFLGWTLFQVPYLAWGAEISCDYRTRTRVTGFREGAGLLGILVAGGVPVLLGLNEPKTQISLIAGIAIAIGIPAIIGLVLFVPDTRSEAAKYRQKKIALATSPLGDRRKRTFWTQWRDGWRTLGQNRLFVRLLVAWLINGLANGLPAVCFPLFVRYGLGLDREAQNILILIYFVCAVIAIPGWGALAVRVGKHRAWCLAMCGAIAAFVFVPLLGSGQMAGFAVICAVTGAALGADLALPPAIQADVDDWDQYRFSKGRTGLLFALWNMANKLALALAAGIALPILAWAGLQTGGALAEMTANSVEPVAGATRWVLILIYAVIPVVLKSIAVGSMWGFPLDARHQTAISRRLTYRAV